MFGLNASFLKLGGQSGHNHYCLRLCTKHVFFFLFLKEHQAPLDVAAGVGSGAGDDSASSAVVCDIREQGAHVTFQW